MVKILPKIKEKKYKFKNTWSLRTNPLEKITCNGNKSDNVYQSWKNWEHITGIPLAFLAGGVTWHTEGSTHQNLIQLYKN